MRDLQLQGQAAGRAATTTTQREEARSTQYERIDTEGAASQPQIHLEILTVAKQKKNPRTAQEQINITH